MKNIIMFVQQYAAELIAIIAVCVSILANQKTRTANERANELSQKLEIAEKAGRRTQMLVEIERKNVAVGKLSLITARKILLLQKYRNLASKHAIEYKRLVNNFELLQGFKKSEEEQRLSAEIAGSEMDVCAYQEALADLKRLRVHLEADIDKETSEYEVLVGECAYTV